MLTLGPLAFAAPWLLLALVALPVLWWLLKVTPPAPRRIGFPAIRLLFGLSPEETAARTPWWLLALRMLAAALVILGLAQPVLNPAKSPGGSGPLLLVVDDGWASAPDWPLKRAALDTAIDQAEREGRAVGFIATSAGSRGEAPAASPFLPAAEARRRMAALRPNPWVPDRAAAARAVEALPVPATPLWISDGLAHGDDAGVQRLVAALQRLGRLEVLLPAADRPARIVAPPRLDQGRMLLSVRQAPQATASETAVLARTGDGRALARVPLAFAPGATEAEAPLSLPPELRNRLTRIEVEGAISAAAVALSDERWRRRPVGLVSGSPESADQPLIGDLYYLDRALSPFAEIRRGPVRDLLKREIAMIVLADLDQLAPDETTALETWVSRGGVLVRFAGPRLAAAPDSLLPVTLRAGDRQLGGALSWAQPAGLAEFPPDSPFAGLPVPHDVTIERQVLAEPSPVLATRTWAKLSDGTPLVTGDRRGSGAVALFHVTANGDWSNLPLSGLFVEMLRRLVAISTGVSGTEETARLPPSEILDGFGRLGAPPPAAAPIEGRDLAAWTPGPRHPPGLYGTGEAKRALNLGPVLPAPTTLGLPATVPRRALADGTGETPLAPPLLTMALLLLLLDLMISLVLRGLVRLPARTAGAAGAAAVVLGLLAAMPAAAQQAGGGAAGVPAAALETRLAYILTGDAQLDEVSRMGLRGLSDYINRRTAASLGDPAGVRPGRDDLAFFPLLYWPVTAAQPEPDAAAAAALNEFMRQGGIILFDTRDQGSGEGFSPGAAAALRRIGRSLSIPALAPVPTDHVLARAFYLLTEFPGRFAGGQVWVQRDQDRANDSVSPVIIGGHDWASAWAVDGQGRRPFATLPGGERQRTLAYRFGVNLVMYALTGNYKGDQVHVPSILERIGQ
jgi:hypothetical protein